MEFTKNPSVHSVTQLNNRVKSYIEKKYSSIYVTGEVSSYQLYPSGHSYFVLKDVSSEISCVFFNAKLSNTLDIRPGMQLTLKGKVSLYTAKGKFQFIVDSLYPIGHGIIHDNFEKLKIKLKNEGLFLDENKKKITKFPVTVGIITSLRGAVIKDVIKVFKNKAPNVQLIIRNTFIQGSSAVKEISNAIKDLNNFNRIDTIILCRGGGSIEDLAPFNDEKVVRSIFKSSIPVISGVGHETDFTLTDMVADVRASTPTAAAEISVYYRSEILQRLDLQNKKINYLIINKINNIKSQIKSFKNRKAFYILEHKLLTFKRQLSSNKKDLVLNVKNKFSNYHNKINILKSYFENLDPDKVLSKGYAIVKLNGNIISEKDNISIGEKIKIYLKSKKIKSEILKIEKK